jgi:hypothetical protein
MEHLYNLSQTKSGHFLPENLPNAEECYIECTSQSSANAEVHTMKTPSNPVMNSAQAVAEPGIQPLAPIADIHALAWMTGSWSGLLDGELVDEHWSAPAGGMMMGMFRWLKNERVYYYELLVIEPASNGLVLRLKHFDSGLNGWEEKGMAVAYPLVHASEREATFERGGSFRSTRFVYRRVSDNELLVTTHDRKGDGIVTCEFRYTLA